MCIIILQLMYSRHYIAHVILLIFIGLTAILVGTYNCYTYIIYIYSIILSLFFHGIHRIYFHYDKK